MADALDWTPDAVEFLRRHRDLTSKEVANMIAPLLNGRKPSISTIAAARRRFGCRSTRYNIFTDEEAEWLTSYIPDHTYGDVIGAFKKRFDRVITRNNLKGFCNSHSIHSKAALEARNQMLRNDQLGTHRDLKTDGVLGNGYMFSRDPVTGEKRNRSHVVWEANHGEVPEGCHVWHLDGDRKNDDINNLVLMTPRERSLYRQIGVKDFSKEARTSLILAIKLQELVNLKKKEGKT